MAGQPQLGPSDRLDEINRLRAQVRQLRAEHHAARQTIGELTEAVAARDAYMALVCAEVRNPLTPIALEITSLRALTRRAVELPAWVHDRIDAVERRTRAFLRRTELLLDTSVVASGGRALAPEVVSLSDLVAELVREVMPEASRARSVVRLDVQAEVTGLWDSCALQQVTFTLLSNAIKYGAGRPIDVTVTADAHAATLQVRDAGCGITQAERDRIFASFERALTRSPKPGLGLSLWAARRLLEAHGGELRVEGDPGVGSLFTARLSRAIPMPPK